MFKSIVRSLVQMLAAFVILVIPIGLVVLAGLIVLPAMELVLGTWEGRAVTSLTAAGLIILIMRTIMGHGRAFMNGLIPMGAYDPNQVLREFSIGISSINDSSMLATVAIGLISEAVEFQRGYLFEVEHESSPAPGIYRLTGVGGMGQVSELQHSGILAASNPIARFLSVERNPIASKTLLHNRRFTSAPESERAWLESLDMALFAPVHTKQEWIGLIALGPKKSGVRYSAGDLALIGTLADQLSLSLQNARLIASLMRVNNDFRRAYTSMEQSNRQLQLAISQLEKMDETKSDFINVASHELRTPLTVMRGYTEMLVEDTSLKSNALHQKMLKGIHAGILRLHEIIESMLDVASIDSRSLSLHKQPISINHIIQTVAGNLKSAMDDRQLDLVMENLRDLPSVEADSDALIKVFYHVLVNAIKYTPDGGKITIHGVVVSPGQAGLNEGGVEIIFSDTGIGIDQSNLELIFRKFYQTGKVSLHSSGKTKFKGAGPGLGLAIAKGIVEAHNGRIWAESQGHNEEKRLGSQFHVVLPFR